MKIILWLFLAGLVGSIELRPARADDLFQMVWRTAYYTTNSSGNITAVSFTEQDMVNMFAQSSGVDPSQLVLVYRPRKRDVAVV